MHDNLDYVPPLVFGTAKKLTDAQLGEISTEIYSAMSVDAEEEVKGIDPMFIISIVLAVLQACVANRLHKIRTKLITKTPGSLLHRRLAKNLRIRIQDTAVGQNIASSSLDNIAQSMVVCFGDLDNHELVQAALQECKE